MTRICLLLILACSLQANAQFFQGFGVTLGGTYSTQRWKLSNDESIRQRYKLSYNGSVFVEMFEHEYIRLITEIEYNRKGARMRYPVDDRSPIKANYVSLNNFLKFRQELYDVTPYWYIGPKIEYALSPGYSPLHVSGATGIGIELLKWDPWIWFADFQWNPDIMPSMKASGGTTTDVVPPPVFTNRIRHNAFLLRIGVKFLGKPKRTKCPAYADPA